MEVEVIKRKEKEQKRLRVAAYCRVSTDNEEQEGSIENQIDHYTKLIRNNPDYEFAGVYYDVGISGFKEKRPGFQEMMEDARNNKIDLIITKSITRFARNTGTVLKATRELKEKGIGVFFELQNINTLSQSGEMLMTVYAAFGQGESESNRRLSQMSVKRRFEDGKPEYGLYKTLGYTKDADGNIVIVPEEAAWVKQIFTWVKENYSRKTMVKMAAAAGITKKGGSPVDGSWVNSTIRNVAYKGDYIMQSTFVDENRKKHIHQDIVPSYYIEHDHPAIVSKVLWKKANQILDEHIEEKNRHIELKPMTEENYPYRNKLYCAECGRRLKPVKTKSSLQYSFTCGNRKYNGKTVCSGLTVTQKTIEGWGELPGNIYISYDPDKPIHKQYSFVQESTWRKDHKKVKKEPLPEYSDNTCHYYRKVYCDHCGHLLTRTRRSDGRIIFVCGGMDRYGISFCKGVKIPKEDLDRLPETEGIYVIKEEVKDGKKSYSYSCQERAPRKKRNSKSGK